MLGLGLLDVWPGISDLKVLRAGIWGAVGFKSCMCIFAGSLSNILVSFCFV